ncbi:hypothetical protein GCAAIG_10530 [Candidatus Electronema halotolerans]
MSEDCRRRVVTGGIIGLMLVLVAIVLLFWNARQSVHICKTIRAGTAAVRSVPADRVDPANQGRLVHVTGMTVTETALIDPVFGVAAKALKLRRKVEMYQWHEDSAKSYGKVWSDRVINSANHKNPGSMPYQNAEQLAAKVRLGAFTLPASLVRKIDEAQPLLISIKLTLPKELAGRAQRQEGGFYIGDNPALPQIGDLRISFEIVPQQEISVIARQNGSSLTPFPASSGRELFAVKAGLLTARHIFHKAEGEKIGLTWRLRLLGFILMFAGLFLLLRMLSMRADIHGISTGIGIISFLTAWVFFLVTIAAAWITFRPLLGLGLLAAAAVPAFLVRAKLNRAKPPGS